MGKKPLSSSSHRDVQGRSFKKPGRPEFSLKKAQQAE